MFVAILVIDILCIIRVELVVQLEETDTVKRKTLGQQHPIIVISFISENSQAMI